MNNTRDLSAGDIITFRTFILQGGISVQKTLKGSVKNISNDNVFLDTNYFIDAETGKRMMQPNIKINNEIKPLILIKKNRIIDYQNLKEEYNSKKPTSKYEAVELLKNLIHKILMENVYNEDTTSTALYGGGNYNGIAPSYNQNIPIGQNKISDGQVSPEDSLRLMARKNLEDIKNQTNISQKSADAIERKAIEDFCFKYPSLLIYL